MDLQQSNPALSVSFFFIKFLWEADDVGKVSAPGSCHCLPLWDSENMHLSESNMQKGVECVENKQTHWFVHIAAFTLDPHCSCSQSMHLISLYWVDKQVWWQLAVENILVRVNSIYFSHLKVFICVPISDWLAISPLATRIFISCVCVSYKH